MKKGMFVALITGLVLGVGSQVHAIDLGGMVSKASGDGSKASAEDPTVAQSNLVERFVGSAQQISYAQVQFGKALGLKDEAAALEAETKALGSGSVSESALKKHQARSEALNEELEARMESGAMLTAEGRKMFASGLLPFSQGLAEGVQMKPESEQFAQSVQNYVKVASPMDKMKIMKQVKPGLYVASNMPAYIGKLSSTSKAIFDYAKSNKIEIPKEAAAALGEL